MNRLKKKRVRSRILRFKKLAETDLSQFRNEWQQRLLDLVKEINRRSGIFIVKNGIVIPAARRVIEDAILELRACGEKAYLEMSSVTMDTLRQMC